MFGSLVVKMPTDIDLLLFLSPSPPPHVSEALSARGGLEKRISAPRCLKIEEEKKKIDRENPVAKYSRGCFGVSFS